MQADAQRARPDARGAAVVESAIIIPVALLIVFAVLELGMMFRSATVTSTASRAGVRVASAALASAPTSDPTNSPTITTKREVADLVAGTVSEALRDRTSGDTPLQLRIYRAGTDGRPHASTFDACATDCYRYQWNGSGWSYVGGSWTAPDACGATIHSIGVWVSVRHDPMNSFMPIGGTLEERTVMRLEPRPGSECTGAGGET